MAVRYRATTTFRGLYTYGPARFSFWWAALRWSLIESIDGLEFV